MLKKFNLKNIKLDKNKLKEKYNEIKSQYDKDAILYTVLLAGIIGFGLIKFVVPAFSELGKNFNEITNQYKTAKAMEKKIDAARLLEIKEEKAIELPVKIYESSYKDVELESAATVLINSVISIIRNNGDNKVSAFDFSKKDLTDISGLKSPNHSILQIAIQMQSSYENVQNIINEIYLMEYLIKIDNVSLQVDPDSNYTKINVYMVLDLFIKTS